MFTELKLMFGSERRSLAAAKLIHFCSIIISVMTDGLGTGDLREGHQNIVLFSITGMVDIT